MREGKHRNDPYRMTDLCQVMDSVGSLDRQGHVVDDPSARWYSYRHVGKAVMERSPEGESRGVCERVTRGVGEGR